MAKVYRPYFPEQDFLLPPSLREWLPENHLGYFVSDLIDELDLSQIERHYEREERGYSRQLTPAFLQKMQLPISGSLSRRWRPVSAKSTFNTTAISSIPAR